MSRDNRSVIAYLDRRQQDYLFSGYPVRLVGDFPKDVTVQYSYTAPERGHSWGFLLSHEEFPECEPGAMYRAVDCYLETWRDGQWWRHTDVSPDQERPSWEQQCKYWKAEALGLREANNDMAARCAELYHLKREKEAHD